MDYVPNWIYQCAWNGHARDCPLCQSRFRSNFDRGQCPACQHVFLASEIYGLPSDLTVDQVIDSSLALWQPDQQLLDALLPVEGFPIPVVTPFPKDEQADWDWHRRWLEAGLAYGGSLYSARRAEGPTCWVDFYYVVKEARLLAWMQTSIFLAD